MSQDEKWMQEKPYAIENGDDGTEKQCSVFRNFAADEAGHLIDRDDETIHSLY